MIDERIEHSPVYVWPCSLGNEYKRGKKRVVGIGLKFGSGFKNTKINSFEDNLPSNWWLMNVVFQINRELPSRREPAIDMTASCRCELGILLKRGWGTFLDFFDVMNTCHAFMTPCLSSSSVIRIRCHVKRNPFWQKQNQNAKTRLNANQARSPIYKWHSDNFNKETVKRTIHAQS